MEIEKVDGAPSAGGTVYLDVVPAEGESGTPIGDDVPRGTYVIDNHKYTSREKVRLLTLKPGVQFTIVICALIDIFMLLAQAGAGQKDPKKGQLVVTWMIMGIYISELILRIYALHPHLFFQRWYNWFDFVVVVLSLVLLSLENKGAAAAAASATRSITAIFRLAQVLRAARAISIIKRQASHGVKHAARNVTGENKKRFVDLANGIDIDLTYITTQIIAMGVPAQGFVALYRNPISDVVNFFNLRHQGKYRIYNICPELPYPAERFDNNVRAFDVQDHTPPNMDIIMEFLSDASKFVCEGAEKDRVIAVHCRGGKGRTGTLVCAWLLYAEFCTTDDKALRHFAISRTELRKGSKTLQGVDTPSQKRYINHVSLWLERTGAYLGRGTIEKPPATTIRLKQVTIAGFFADPLHVEGPLVAAVHINGEGGGKVVKVSPALGDAAIVSNNLIFDLQNFECGGDVRITIFKEHKLKEGVDAGYIVADSEEIRGNQFTTKRKIAGKEPGVLFYFLFHSEFVDRETNQVKVPMNMMDKAFKNKKKLYLPEGMATLDVEYV